MSVFSEIVNGWGNYIFKNKEVEIIAKERLTLCCDCDGMAKNATCNFCGCYIPAKVRSINSTCPKKKW